MIADVTETGPATRPVTRIETSRRFAAPAADVFALLCDPAGHVAIDSSGMLQDCMLRHGYPRG